MHGLGERLLQRTNDETAHQARIAKAHFRLGRMHIHIDETRIANEKQRQRRMTVAGQIIHIGRAHSAIQHFVTHRATVDIEILRLRIGAMEGRQTGKAGELKTLARSTHRQRIGREIAAQNLADARQSPGIARAAIDMIEA